MNSIGPNNNIEIKIAVKISQLLKDSSNSSVIHLDFVLRQRSISDFVSRLRCIELIGSIEHGFDFIVESLIIKIIDFNRLEIFFWIKVALSDKESLTKNKFLL